MEFLNLRYETRGFDFIPIYGRRRVGKTELISEFVKGKKTIVYSAVEQNDKISLADLSGKVTKFFMGASGLVFNSWDNLFEYMGKNLDFDEKIVFAIDEYPYLCDNNRSISSVLQKHMDTTFKDKNIMFILCGSSMSFMENQVLGYKSPLYGRRTGQIKLLPFDYHTAAKFMKNASKEDKILLFAVADGIPQYLKYLSQGTDLKENIIQNFFNTTGHLFEEPLSLLKQELRKPANYFSILSAIASGKTKLNEISTASGVENTACSKYLKVLIDLRIIEREVPTGFEKAKNGIYRLRDNCFYFWFRYVHKNITNIEFGNGANVWESIQKENLSTYLGLIFEKVCMEYMLNHINELPIFVQSIGRWWGNNPIKKQQEEIDILAISESKQAIFGECKWKNEKSGIDIVEDLKRKSLLFNQCKEKYFYLFSKAGFTKSAYDCASKEDNIYLISLKDMI